MWFFKIIESFFKRERGEQGSGLMTVLGVSLVVTIAAGTVTSSIVMASNMTAETLSRQQADEAAEAGINDAINTYSTGECKSYITKNSSPKYTYSFYRSTSDTAPSSKTSTATYAGCPKETGSIADRWMLIESVGYGKNNTSKTKTAVFKVTPKNMNVIPQAITANKVDLKTRFNLNTNPSVVGSNVSIYTSDLVCDVGTSTTKSVVNANLKYDSSLSLAPVGNCTINGNIEANIDSASGVVDLNGMDINGNICSSTNFQNIEGLKGEKRTSVNIPCNYEGTRYGYIPDMSNSVEVKTAGCTDWGILKEQIETVSGQNDGKNNILDLTACGSGSDNTKLRKIMYDDASTEGSGSRDLSLKGDINLVFSKGFLLNNSTIKSESPSDNHTINFIIPSNTADSSQSSIPSGTGTAFFRNVKYDDGISGTIYTPSNFTAYTGTVINGQIYAGGTFTSNTVVTLNYMPVGLPDAEKQISKDINSTPDLIRVY